MLNAGAASPTLATPAAHTGGAASMPRTETAASVVPARNVRRVNWRLDIRVLLLAADDHILSIAAMTVPSVRICGSKIGAALGGPGGYSAYSGTPLRPSEPSIRPMTGSRAVQSALSVTTPFFANASATADECSAARSLTRQVTHQAAVKLTKTGLPAARAAASRSGLNGSQPTASPAGAGERAPAPSGASATITTMSAGSAATTATVAARRQSGRTAPSD